MLGPMAVTLLAVSADDSRLAYIHGGRLVLCDARGLAELTATEAPEGARALAFYGPPHRLVVATDDELYTYELGTLSVLRRRTTASGARLAAVVENRAVLWIPTGPSLAIVRFLDDAIDLQPLDTSGAPVDVAPLEQHQALVVTVHRNEVIDLTTRQVVARLNLPLPPSPRLVGQSGGWRFLWATQPGSPTLTVIRLSDGRTFTTELPAPLRQVVSGPTASWLCALTDDGLFRVHVVTQAVHRVTADLTRGACIGGAADAGLYWIDASWRLRRTSLAGDAVAASGAGPLRLAFAGVDEGRPTPQAAIATPAAPTPLAQLEPSTPVAMAPVTAPPLFVDPPPVRPGSWTAPLAAPPPPPPAEPARGGSRLDDRLRRAGLRAARAEADVEAEPPPSPSPHRPPPEPELALAPPAAPLAPLALAALAASPLAEESPEAEPVRPASWTAEAPTIGGGLTPDARPVRSWRMQCAAWARQVLTGRDQLEPSFAGTPLGLLARRAGLDADGTRALALLYGAWLLGRPAQPLARLGRVIAWDELAGRGGLPEAGLHAVRRGRAALRPTVARFLDGARARRITVHGARPRAGLPTGRQLVRCSPELPVASAAQEVAERLGAAAVIDERTAHGRGQFALALDEAWLREVPAVVVPGAELDVTAVAAARLRRDHLLVVLWPDSVVPTPLEDLPVLEL